MTNWWNCFTVWSVINIDEKLPDEAVQNYLNYFKRMIKEVSFLIITFHEFSRAVLIVNLMKVYKYLGKCNRDPRPIWTRIFRANRTVFFRQSMAGREACRKNCWSRRAPIYHSLQRNVLSGFVHTGTHNFSKSLWIVYELSRTLCRNFKSKEL